MLLLKGDFLGILVTLRFGDSTRDGDSLRVGERYGERYGDGDYRLRYGDGDNKLPAVLKSVTISDRH